MVEVFLRVVRVSTGRVVRPVNARKTIYPLGLQDGVFRHFDLQEIL